MGGKKPWILKAPSGARSCESCLHLTNQGGVATCEAVGEPVALDWSCRLWVPRTFREEF